MKLAQSKVYLYPLIAFCNGIIASVAIYFSGIYTPGYLISGLIGVSCAFLLTASVRYINLARIFTSITKPSSVERLQVLETGRLGFYGVGISACVFILEVGCVSALLARGFLWVIPCVFSISAMAAVFGTILGTPAGDSSRTEDSQEITAADNPKSPKVSLLHLTLLVAQLGLFLVITMMLTKKIILGPLLVALCIAAAVPHVLSLFYKGVTEEILSASILISHVISLGVILLFPYDLVLALF